VVEAASLLLGLGGQGELIPGTLLWLGFLDVGLPGAGGFA